MLQDPNEGEFLPGLSGWLPASFSWYLIPPALKGVTTDNRRLSLVTVYAILTMRVKSSGQCSFLEYHHANGEETC